MFSLGAPNLVKNCFEGRPLQYSAKEMRANKLRNFVSDENSAKFRRIYCSSPRKISEATILDKTEKGERSLARSTANRDFKCAHASTCSLTNVLSS